MPDRANFDTQMMFAALRMAKRGLGLTAPNPSVGTVIADEATGEVIARGWTQSGGRPHAETEGLRRAGVHARGATMYVTLEPCAHHGKTPPCSDAIVAAGLKRVVVGCGDPDPRTAGQGLARLRAAGIDVTEGVLAEEARWMALGHILRVTDRRPFVQLKMALANDGTIHRGYAGTPIIVTGPEARAQGHLMRAEADAILVGHQTVRDDNPELTCRLPGLKARSPVRVVATTNARDLEKSALTRSADDTPLWIVCGAEATSEAIADLKQAGAEVFTIDVTAGKVSVQAIAETLARQGITRLLVEGGPEIWRSFAKAGLVDEAVVFHAHVDGYAIPSYQQSAGNALKHYLPGAKLETVASRRVGSDAMLVYRRA